MALWWSKARRTGGQQQETPPPRRRWLGGFLPPQPRLLRVFLLSAGVLTLLVATGLGITALWAFAILPRSLPPVSALETFQPVQGSKIYDDNDELITELHVERRIFVPLAQIPTSLRDAIIATEDRRVYTPSGIAPIGAARAPGPKYRPAPVRQG